jgi:hypothetical protein
MNNLYFEICKYSFKFQFVLFDNLNKPTEIHFWDFLTSEDVGQLMGGN